MQKFDRNPFELQTHLDWLYGEKPSRFRFNAHSIKEFYTWRDSFKTEVTRLLGIAGRDPRIIKVLTNQSINHEKYEEQHISLEIGEEIVLPIYMMCPNSKPPYHPILVFHGHDPSVKYCMGNYPDEQTKKKNLELQNNYAQSLANAGYLVCVVEQRGMGNRITGQVSSENGRSCRHLAFSYLLHGKTLLGERVFDGMTALTYLMSRSDVVGKPGCTGHSGGGTTALWLSALDDRIHSVVISGCFSSFKESILAMEHCECNYVPGIFPLGEMVDLAAMIAPRPLCIIQGEQDPIYPIDSARSEFLTVQKAYLLNGQADAVNLAVHPGGHAYDNQIARDWFDQWLV